MSMKWTQQEDNLLKQLDALGYSSSKIYKEYGSILKNRSQNALTVVCRYMESDTENASKHAERTTKLLEEIKANGTLQQGTLQSIKHELQKVAYRGNKKWNMK